jgi:hypothetical protein
VLPSLLAVLPTGGCHEFTTSVFGWSLGGVVLLTEP